MLFMIGDEVRHKSGGQRMIVTGLSSGMVECRWYDGRSVRREAFHEDELQSASQESRMEVRA